MQTLTDGLLRPKEGADEAEADDEACAEDAATVAAAVQCVCKLLEVCVRQGCLTELLASLAAPPDATLQAAFSVRSLALVVVRLHSDPITCNASPCAEVMLVLGGFSCSRVPWVFD